MAICHTQKEIHAAKSGQRPEEMLQSNQAMYKPCSVFSAGRCELVYTLDDGRMLINVHLQARYHCVQEIQELPYTICRCEEYADLPHTDRDVKNAEALRQKILQRLYVLTAGDELAQKALNAVHWENKSLQVFSFAILAALQFDADFKQQMLECQSLLQRLQGVYQRLR